MVIVVCFVGGMLYYSMNVLWPRQSQAFFIPEGDIIMRGVYAVIFSCGTWRMYIPVAACPQADPQIPQSPVSSLHLSALVCTMRSGSSSASPWSRRP